MWAEILERHLDDRRKNDYHRSDIGKFYCTSLLTVPFLEDKKGHK